MDKIGWKVVEKKTDGRLTSYVLTDSVWTVEYQVGKRVVGRNGTPLLAFSSRAKARAFGHNVFKAQLEGTRPVETIMYADMSHLFGRFWTAPNTLDWPSSTQPPDGTLACDAITLLEPA